MSMLADKIIAFNRSLSFRGKLPDGIRILNPFRENKEVLPAMELFCKKFYNDNRKRKIILGINPGRHGAGTTGVPFTDTKRLAAICNIKMISASTHEPSSVFIYDMMDAFGGAKKFYREFLITAICPLGFVEKNERGNWVNRNYYDYPELFKAVEPFIIRTLRQQVRFSIETNTCFVLGKKNAVFLQKINDREKFFKKIVVLEHPRYIQQYKLKSRDKYIKDYLKRLKETE